LGFWLIVCTTQWLWSKKNSRRKRRSIVIISAVALLLVTSLAVHYLRIQIAGIEARNVEPEYPNVFMTVGQDKVLHLKNNSHHDITGLTVIPTEYALDWDAMKVSSVQIENSEQTTAIVSIPVIAASASMRDVDLKTFIKFSPFTKEVPMRDETRFLALRIAFTGGIPAKKYVYYKITSSMVFNPFVPDNPEQVFGWGGPDNAKLLRFEYQIIDTLKQNQREMYGTEYEEYKLQL
jgi:hypothetical protein